MLIFNIQTFFNFQFQMFKCLLTPTHWVFNSVINYLLYTQKFLRYVIFTDFMVDQVTAKI